MAIAVKIPIMATTIRTSIRVNPFMRVLMTLPELS
jgi:hypothetical protein